LTQIRNLLDLWLDIPEQIRFLAAATARDDPIHERQL
jgi:hypothetical protein